VPFSRSSHRTSKSFTLTKSGRKITFRPSRGQVTVDHHEDGEHLGSEVMTRAKARRVYSELQTRGFRPRPGSDKLQFSSTALYNLLMPFGSSLD
jgi:hypothetical protein